MCDSEEERTGSAPVAGVAAKERWVTPRKKEHEEEPERVGSAPVDGVVS